MNPIIECVPNFSEGQNQLTIDEIANAIKNIDGVKLLHTDSGKAANRTVYTFAGEMKAVFEAAYQAIKLATELIDMEQQKGEHPRIGACDVCPFVPISGIKIEELIPHVQEFAKKVAQDFQLPIFLYEESAASLERRNLARHRIGDYENLKSRIENAKWLPDYGTYNSKTGGCVMGVRNFLIAYNINLNTADAEIAKEIAYDLREIGRPIKNAKGKTTYTPGKLKFVKAIGWYIEDFKRAQVSINLINYKKTPLHLVFEGCAELAILHGTKVTGSELIGLIPLQSLLIAGQFYNHLNKKLNENELVQLAIQQLGLNELESFIPNERIIEFALKNK